MRLKAEIGDRTYWIEDDLPGIGSYLRVFENGMDLYDYLQDSMVLCQEFAMEEFGVALDAWHVVSK